MSKSYQPTRNIDMEAASQSNTVTIVSQTGFCVDCGDQPAVLICDQCHDEYCLVCNAALHRKGRRSNHTFTNIKLPNQIEKPNPSIVGDEQDGKYLGTKIKRDPSLLTSMHDTSNDSVPSSQAMSDAINPVDISSKKLKSQHDTESVTMSELSPLAEQSDMFENEDCIFLLPKYQNNFPYLPLRLDDDERELLKILEEAITISEYTDKIDIMYGQVKLSTMTREIERFLIYLQALLLTHDARSGRKTLLGASKELKLAQESTHRSDIHHLFPFASSFQRIIEIGRRHKIRNPDKMRSTYGKLMHLLMDAQRHEIIDYFGFSLVIPIKTALSLVLTNLTGTLSAAAEKHSQPISKSQIASVAREHALAFFQADDKLLRHATSMIRQPCQSDSNLARPILSPEIQSKAIAWREGKFQRYLATYSSSNSPIKIAIDEQVLKDVAIAVSDATNYIGQASMPVDYLISLIDHVADVYDFTVRAGQNKARISHSHDNQIEFVTQSFQLWKSILSSMVRLWFAADTDMLNSSNRYQLRNTGQGLNRMQSAPEVANIMHNAVSSLARRIRGAGSSWVGSAAVHLGDISVPNALVFIDKYCQVERITAPVMNTILSLTSDFVQGQIANETIQALFSQYFNKNSGDSEGSQYCGDVARGFPDQVLRDFLLGVSNKASKSSKMTRLQKMMMSSARPRNNDSWRALFLRLSYARWVSTYPLSRQSMQNYRNDPVSEKILDALIHKAILPSQIAPHVAMMEKSMPLISAISTPKIRNSIQFRFLHSFFTMGFNGSGEKNATAMTAGSCIDGRLTSLWEFCNSIEKTDYFHPLLVGGFSGFDSAFN